MTNKPNESEGSPLWPENMTTEDMLQRLALLDPDKRAAFDVLLEFALRESWPQAPRPRHVRRSTTAAGRASH